MNILTVALKEITYRRLSFLMGTLAVAIAVGCSLGGALLLKSFDIRTEQLVDEKERAAQDQMTKMQDEYRKITKRMGFNVLILPQKQNLSDFYDKNYATEFMPESYAEKLANAKGIATIRHLLPMLQIKTEWPEKKRRILLIGVRGEMPWAHRGNKKPLLKEVPPNGAAIGYELYRSLNIKKGDMITFMGKSFKVHALKEERGTVDDITLWLPLNDVQQFFDKQGKINSMLALECSCAFANLPKVRKEIQRILPDTQVLELSGKAIARAEARWEAAKNAELLIEREKETRARLRMEREKMISLLVPLVIVACSLWIAILALLNVRERHTEIGLFRALGVGTPRLLALFLYRAIFKGFTGALLGIIATILVSSWCLNDSPTKLFSTQYVALVYWLATPVIAIIITVAASWLPALMATQVDPAEILREE